MDKTVGHTRLRRWGAKQPIANSIMLWNDLNDAVEYFRSQKLSSIEVLHYIEIQSCDKLINLLGMTRQEFSALIQVELEGCSEGPIHMKSQALKRSQK